MKGSIRRAAGGLGALALAVVTAGTASAGSLEPGVHQQTRASGRSRRARSRFRPPSTSA